jgi:hypothetical protein
MYRTMRFILDFIHRLEYMTENSQRFGDWICLGPQVMGQDRPTQLGPLERDDGG